MKGCKISRAIECISTHSRLVGPFRDRPFKYTGAWEANYIITCLHFERGIPILWKWSLFKEKVPFGQWFFQIWVPVVQSMHTCMCTKGRGTNSEKPPVFLASFLKRSKCLALDHKHFLDINKNNCTGRWCRDTVSNYTRSSSKVCDKDLPVVRPIKMTEHDSWCCTESYPMCRLHNLHVSAQWIWHGSWQQEYTLDWDLIITDDHTLLMVIILQCTKN